MQGALVSAPSPQIEIVATIAEMKSLSMTQAVDLGQVQALGYYAPNDGGGGIFSWDAASSKTDNGGTVIAPSELAATGRWIRNVGAWVSARWFGARGDGVNEDASKIQAALLHAHANGGATIRVPKGIYKLSSTLHMGRNTTLLSEAGVVYKRDHKGSLLDNGLGVTHNTKGYDGNGNINIDGGIWEGNSIEHYCAFNFLSLGNAEGVSIKNAFFLDGVRAHAMDISACRNVSIENCMFLGFSKSLGLEDDHLGADRAYAEAIQLDQNIPGSFGFGALDRTMCEHVTVRNCRFSSNPAQTDPRFASWGVGIGSHGAVHDRYIKQITVESCTFDGCQYAGIRALKWQNFTARGNTFLNCRRGIHASGVGYNWDSAKDANNHPSGIPQAGRDHIITRNTFTNCIDPITYVAVPFAFPYYAKHLGLTIDNNVINFLNNTGKSAAISLQWVSRANISRNCIRNPCRGVYLRFCDNIGIERNEVTNSSREMIYADESSETSFSGLGYTSDLLVEGNFGRNIGYSGIVISGALRRVKILNNTFLGVSTSESAGYGIACVSGAQNLWIDENVVADGGAPNKPQWGAYLSGSCINVRLGSNDLFGTHGAIKNDNLKRRATQ